MQHPQIESPVSRQLILQEQILSQHIIGVLQRQILLTQPYLPQCQLITPQRLQ